MHSKILILCFALANVLCGRLLLAHPAALPFGRSADGSLLYPVSSGSGDAHLLAYALTAFLFSAVMALFSKRLGAAAYALNLFFLWAALGFIALDSSLVAAAQAGFFLPLLAVVWAHLPVLFWLVSFFRQPERTS